MLSPWYVPPKWPLLLRSVLQVVNRRGDATPPQIVAACGYHKTTVEAACRELERRGWLERRENRHGIYYELTGRDGLESFMEHLNLVADEFQRTRDSDLI